MEPLKECIDQLKRIERICFNEIEKNPKMKSSPYHTLVRIARFSRETVDLVEGKER